MEERKWWIYKCREPDCGTVLYIGARAGVVPEEERVCRDCDGISELKNPDAFRSRYANRYPG